MSCSFIPQALPFTKRRISVTRIVQMKASNSSKSLTSCTRRAFLASVSVLTSSLVNSAPSHSYSSPYNPNQSGDEPLPERLYENTASKVVTTQSGLQYFDLKPGTGKQVTEGDTVFVYYTSRLRGLNGIKIQSTYDDPSTPPFIFKVGNKDVVPGLSETVKGMQSGGKRRAVLPPQIAYASADMKPAVTEFFARRRLLSVLETNRDATIVFDVELVKVK